MICVACNARNSFENIEKWRAEIQAVETSKPIILILTKSDLAVNATDPVTEEELVDYQKEQNYQGASSTSSREWEDFNVHKAFNKTLTTAYALKYDV